jgi:ATP-dependent Lon protease
MEKSQKTITSMNRCGPLKEMGGEEGGDDDIKELEKWIKRKKMSKEANGKARQELNKLKMMTPYVCWKPRWSEITSTG